MNRLTARFELCGLAIALAALGPACNPKSNVAPGAPVLIEMKIIEGGGASVTTIPASTPECPATAIGVDGGINGGMCDPTVAICRQVSANSWCRCVPNAAPTPPPPPGPNCVDGSVVDAATPTPDAGATDAGTADAGAADAAAPLGGTYDCSPFSPSAVPVFVFDRLLDTTPFTANDAGTITNVATTIFTPTQSIPVGMTALYNSNGSPNEVIFPLLGDNLSDGPGLLFTATPALPTGATVAISLNPTTVRAKDGHTQYSPGGTALMNPVSFQTAAFSASFSSTPTPPALPADAGVCTPAPTDVAPDNTPVVLTFNNYVDLTTVAVTATATAGGTTTSVPVTVTSKDNLNVTITPVTSWPPSSAISVSVEPAAADVLGAKLGAGGTPAPTTFTTSAM